MTMLARTRKVLPGPALGPSEIFTLFTGPQVPDPITFIIGSQWLDRGNLYPRQATLIKLIFLRDDLFTDYDRMVIDEWVESFELTGNNGIQTDIYERIKILKAEGRRWFREILLIMGRRAGKGHVSALAFGYVLWNYLAKGDPQGFYGVDRDKKLACFIFAGKKDQAKANLFGDLYNVITSGPCFGSYISRAQTDSISIYAPHDFIRMRKLAERGIATGKDQATFILEPKESTLMAGRGPASFCLDPETPVLTADLEWVPIRKLTSGDKVVGFDEYPARKGTQRKMREAEVLRVWHVRKRALRLVFDDGSNVVCSPEHRWLFKDFGKGGGYLWREAEKLRVGSRIRHLVDPWEEDRSWDSGYLAGFYDGEGCVSGWSGRAGNEVFFSQNEGPVLDRVLGILQAKGFDPQHYTNSGKTCQQWSLGGMVDSMAFLGSIRPSRLMVKQRSVWEGVAPRGGLTPSGQVRKDAFKTIVRVEELPEQDLVDIETTTHTFIANGLFSHNCQGYDEMAHVVASGANRSAEDVYNAATPALDQFGKDAFIIAPSSPWQKSGQFYENAQHAVEVDEETCRPVYPEMLLLQLASWDIYKDWEIAHEIDLFPEGFRGDLDEYVDVPLPRLRQLKGAIQAFDDAMARLERANPDTFAVERRSHWANVMDAYLNETKVKQVFEAWTGRLDTYGPPNLIMQESGLLIYTYKAHADPSKSNCNFGLAVAHAEPDENGTLHCVFDFLHHWEPQNFPGGIIDYDEIADFMVDRIANKFYPDEITFDQFNSVATIQKINKELIKQPGPKRVTAYERTATKELNWSRAEVFKTAINMGLVHAPYYEQAENELKFLIDKGNKVVDHPDSGPVQTKDVADCYDRRMEVLTEHGWKLFKDVLPGEKVATRSPEGRLEYQEPTNYIERHHKGVMYEYDSSRLSFSVTPKHRMLVVDPQSGKERFVHAEDLTSQRYFIPKTSVIEDRAPNRIRFDEQDLTPALVRVQGRGGDRSASGWTSEQDAYLIEHYATMSMTDLCVVLGKTRGAIYNRAKPHNLNLKRGQIGDRIGDRPVPLPETKVEDFAAFLGIWLAEGRKMRDKRGYDVKITQTKPQTVKWIDALFQRLQWPVKRSVQKNGETVWVVKSHGLREYLRACQGEGHELLIPDEVFSSWTEIEMRALLEGLLQGDGCWSGQQNRFVGYYSTSKHLIDDVQRLILHLGLSTGRAKVVQRTSQYRANHDLWYVGVNISQRAVLETAKLRQVEYDDMVYCLTVPNSTLLVRRNGVSMWAGNCMFECVYYFLGKQIAIMLEEMGKQRIHGGLQGGTLGIQKTPQSIQPSPNDMFSDFGTSRRVASGQGYGLNRGYRRR